MNTAKERKDNLKETELFDKAQEDENGLRGWQWPIILLLAMIWGSSFILMKKGMEAFPSDQVAALRISIAALALAPFAFTRFRQSQLKHWKAFASQGFFGNFFPAFLFTKAETGISSALAGMLNSLTPLFTIIFGVLLFKTRTKVAQLCGVIIGFLGASGLILCGNKSDLNSDILFSLMIVLATLMYGLAANIIKKYLQGFDPLTSTIWAFTFTGPLALTYLCTTDFFEILQHHPKALSSLGYTCILAIVGTALAVFLYTKVIRKTSALAASSVTYLMPIVAIFWGLLAGETVNIFHFLFMGIILTGVYLINKKTT